VIKELVGVSINRPRAEKQKEKPVNLWCGFVKQKKKNKHGNVSTSDDPTIVEKVVVFVDNQHSARSSRDGLHSCQAAAECRQVVSRHVETFNSEIKSSEIKIF